MRATNAPRGKGAGRGYWRPRLTDLTYLLAAEVLPAQLVFQLGPDLLASDRLQVHAMEDLIDVPGVQCLLLGRYWTRGTRVSKSTIFW